MALIETEAIVLRTYKLAEADKIVLCLTQKTGLIRGVARGARRLKSRFGASLEPFTHISLSYFEKEGRELVSIRQADIIRSHFDLAGSAETVSALEYLAELALEFAPPNEPNERLFRMIKACLAAISLVPANLTAIVHYYELWTLRLSGFLPDLAYLRQLSSKAQDRGRSGLSESGERDRLWLLHRWSRSPDKWRAHAQMRSMHGLTPDIWACSFENHEASVEKELAKLHGV